MENPNFEYFENLQDNSLLESKKTSKKLAAQALARASKNMSNELHSFINAQDDSRGTFEFSYKASRFEGGWLLDSLGEFYEHQWVLDVLRHLKGGKEASVYLCKAGAEVNKEFIAAKVYRPRALRNLKNDHAYREGRANLDNGGKVILNDGMQHAMAKKTNYGKELLHQSWIAYEYTSMQALFAAGASVPEPYAMASNAILMGYVGDIDQPAPTLSEVSLEAGEARELFGKVMENIGILLANDRIHGDLSAYNILYWEGEITLIDFPQVISPVINRNAFWIFQRDVTRVCEYFRKQGVKANDRKLSTELWVKYGFNPDPEIDVWLLDAEDPRDRELWKRHK